MKKYVQEQGEFRCSIYLKMMILCYKRVKNNWIKFLLKNLMADVEMAPEKMVHFGCIKKYPKKVKNWQQGY